MRAVDDGPAEPRRSRAHAGCREWRGADRAEVTIRDLLAHASGLTAYLPFFRDHTGRVEFEHGHLLSCRSSTRREPSRSTATSASCCSGSSSRMRSHPDRRSAARPESLTRRAASRRSSDRLASFFTAEPLTLQSAPRLAGADRADRDRQRGADGCSSARCTTRTPGRSAARRATPACSAPPRPSAPSRAPCCARSPAIRSWRSPETMREFIAPNRHPRQLARARLGHDAADLVVRHAALAYLDRPHRVSPARRSGSTGSATSTSCC